MHLNIFLYDFCVHVRKFMISPDIITCYNSMKHAVEMPSKKKADD